MLNKEAVIEQIKDDIQKHRIIVYMKGTKEMPVCGFSRRIIDILNAYDIEYETIDILQDDTLRASLKEFSDWPTFPQVYIKGEFIGGGDIVAELHEMDELKSLLNE